MPTPQEVSVNRKVFYKKGEVNAQNLSWIRILELEKQIFSKM
jgi:hypothetical protein